jgi:hypothetical protein
MRLLSLSGHIPYLRSVRLLFAVLLCISVRAVTSAAPLPAQQGKLSEKQKIDLLIQYVSDMKGAVFIRNGSEHSPAEAAKHLRQKLSKAGGKVKTAMDFIRHCASVSSFSGEKYIIRLADGRERPSRDVLTEQLKLIEKTKT